MADLPRIDECPINDNGVCGCVPPIPCSEVASIVCNAIRSAYCYGCNRTEAECNLKVKQVRDKIKDLFPEAYGDNVKE